jgi:transcriptional regulator with XRE-family HTH domain
MDSAATAIDEDIGRRVHALRTGAGMTLEALAERSGVSRAMLSRIERGESSPTAQLLNRVCAGLNVTLSTLFAATGQPASPVSRRSDQSTWRDPDTRYLRRVISPPGTGSPTDIIEVEFPAGASVSFASARFSGFDQQVWVLDGAMEMTVDTETYRLDKGDCLHMRLDQAIRFRNPYERPARYAVILTRGGAMP